MSHDQYQARLQRQQETIGRRLEVARANVGELETEYEELDVALRVHARITGDSGKAGKNGASRKSKPSQEYLIFLVLDGAIPKRLSVRDICRIAADEHGREIPVASAASILSAAKKEGKVTNRAGTWGTTPDDFDTSGDVSPEAPSSGDSTSAEVSPA